MLFPTPTALLLPELSSRIPSRICSKTNLAVSLSAVISSKILIFLVYLMICKAWSSLVCSASPSPGLWESEGGRGRDASAVLGGEVLASENILG